MGAKANRSDERLLHLAEVQSKAMPKLSRTLKDFDKVVGGLDCIAAVILETLGVVKTKELAGRLKRQADLEGRNIFKQLMQNDSKKNKEGDQPVDLFIVVDGVRVARRGYPNTPQAKTGVSIEPGWEVMDRDDDTITIKRYGVTIQ
jgi:hypothetical protein